MSAISVLEALGLEIVRALGTVNGVEPFRSTINSINDSLVAFEDIGTNGFPAVSFEISRVEKSGASFGRVRLTHQVRFFLYAKADREHDAKTSVLALLADVERALTREWRAGATAANVKAATSADFVLWDFGGIGPIACSPKKRGDGVALDVSFVAVVHRDIDLP